jgi:hypothetical protein
MKYKVGDLVRVKEAYFGDITPNSILQVVALETERGCVLEGAFVARLLFGHQRTDLDTFVVSDDQDVLELIQQEDPTHEI